MAKRSSLKRRIVLASVGGLSGLLGGLGASIVLTQGNHLDVSAGYAFSAGGVAFGVLLGFLDLPKRAGQAVSVLIAAAMIYGASLGFTTPVLAQECSLRVTQGGGPAVSLTATTRERPLILDLSDSSPIRIQARAPSVDEGVVDVTVLSVEPFGFLADPNGTVVYFDRLVGGESDGTIRIVQTGQTGFELRTDTLETAMLPLGLIELGIDFEHTSTGVRTNACSETAWIRAVAQPSTNLPGQIGLGLMALGLLGFLAMPSIGSSLPKPPPPEPPPPPDEPAKPKTRRSEPRTKDPASEPFIPASAQHAPHVEARVLDAAGARIPLDAPLHVGREYRLELTLKPDLATSVREPAGTDEHRVAVAGRSNGIEIEPFFSFGFAGIPLSIELPMRPKRTGRHDVVVDVTSNGHLLQTERIEVGAVAGETGAVGTHPQATKTVFSASDFSSSDIAARQPRSLLVILDKEDDGTVDARLRDTDGALVVEYDSPLLPAALDSASDAVRSRLRDVLKAGPGKQADATAEIFEAAILDLVKAGRQLHMAVFPRDSVRSGDANKVRDLVRDGAVVQIAQYGGGTGLSTLPWALVYDHPFLPHTRLNRVCPEFATHPVDECPHRDAPEVACPTGFWGYRAIIEEPWITAAAETYVPPLAGSGDVAIGYLDPSLGDSSRQETVLESLGVAPIDGYDQLLTAFRDEAARLGFLYFYAHHDRDPEVGMPGIVVDGQLLSGMSLDALKLEWSERPLVFVNGCASGDYGLDDPVSLLDEFRSARAAGVVTTECTLWDPLAGELGQRIVEGLAGGSAIGPVLHQLLRSQILEHNNPIGFVYRLQALSDTTVELRRPSDRAETVGGEAEAPW